VKTLDDSDRVFSSTSRIIGDSSRRRQLRSFCEEWGKKLFPDGPLGWNDSQLCIAYDYTVPDNSLPVIWASGGAREPWQPLFPRVR
jgi:hypothetical protein